MWLERSEQRGEQSEMRGEVMEGWDRCSWWAIVRVFC